MVTTSAHAGSPLVLAIDAGTTGVTTIVFDLDLQPVARAQAASADGRGMGSVVRPSIA